MRKGYFILIIWLVAILAGALTAIGCEGTTEGEAYSKVNYPKLDSSLNQLLTEYTKNGPQKASDLAQSQGIALKEGMVRVIIEAQADKVDTVIQELTNLGGRVEGKYQNLVQVSVPIVSLGKLSEVNGVNYVRRPAQPIPQVATQSGSGQ